MLLQYLHQISCDWNAVFMQRWSDWERRRWKQEDEAKNQLQVRGSQTCDCVYLSSLLFPHAWTCASSVVAWTLLVWHSYFNLISVTRLYGYTFWLWVELLCFFILCCSIMHTAINACLAWPTCGAIMQWARSWPRP